MKTEQLISALASDLTPVDPSAAERRFVRRLGGAALIAMVAMLLLFRPRPDIVAAAGMPMFWLKLVFTGSLAIAAFVALRRLGFPGMRLGRTSLGAAVPLALIWLAGAVSLLAAAPGERLALVLGGTWVECPLSIALLSIPAAFLAFSALRSLAPTRLPLAGAAAGLFAGAVAALAYSLHCPEMEAPFIAVWYVLGMLLPTGVGALLGRRLLRW